MARVYLVPILLCALAPLQGFAQSSPPPLVSSPPQEDPWNPKEGSSDPYGGYDDEEPAPAPERVSDGGEKRPRGEIIPRRSSSSPRATSGRGTAEALAGVLLGAAGAVPGLMMLETPCLTSDCDSSVNSQFFKGMGVSLAGWTMGVGLGILVGGNLSGGEGGFLPALGGAALGTLVAVAGSVAMMVASVALGAATGGLGLVLFYIGVPLVGIPLLVVTPVALGIRFYEKSHEQAVAERQGGSTDLRVVPTVGVSPSGGLVAGLVGRF